MKIISKFKDFYDYKVAKYGVDEKLVYTRKTYCEYFESLVIDVYTASDDRISEENFNKNLKENFEYFKGINFHKILILGEKLIHLFFTENGVYTHFDAKKLDVSKGTYQSYCSKEITFNDGRNFEITTDFGWDKLFSYDRKKLFPSMRIDKSDIIFNEPMIFGCPIILNPVLLIPFVLNPIICAIIAWIATELGLVNRVVASAP